MKRIDIIKNTAGALKHLALAMAVIWACLSAQAATLTWNVGGSGAWDTTTPNWTEDFVTSTNFTSDGSQDVIFDFPTDSTITNSPNMWPKSTTVSAASGIYTFTGGAITGSGSLTMSGFGTLVISTTNSYTGKTIVQAGTLSLDIPLTSAGVAGPLGAPTGTNAIIDLYSGTTFQVAVPGLANPTSDRAFNLVGIDPGTVSIRVNGPDTSCTFGAVTATGTGAKTLALYTGPVAGGGAGGDRESLIFKGAISDSSDGSPTSLEVTFSTQTAAASYVNLSGTNTFTGPITLVKQNITLTGYLVIGGVRTFLINTPGSGSLGNGNYPGSIALDLGTILEYDSSAAQILSGTITPGASGSGALTKTGSGLLTLSGLNSYTGNTTVSAGTLVLADTGGLSFVVTDTSNTKVTGPGTATLNGSFSIDTTAVTLPVGSWTLVDVATKTFGATFSVAGFTGPDANKVWTQVNGGQIWTFNQTTGILKLSGPASIVAFNIPGAAGVIDENAKTIALTAPYGTSLATLAPTFTLSSGACNQTSGSPPSLTFAAQNPATYTVTDGATVNPYTVTVTVAPVSTAKDILTFVILGKAAVISGTNIDLTFPYGTDFTSLTPTYTVSPLAAQDPLFPSGTVRNFNTPQTYTITAQDGSTKVYLATVLVGYPEALIGHWISGPASLSDTSGYTTAGTHDGVAVGANAGSLAWSSDVPAGFTGQSLNLSADNVAVLITNTATTDANYQSTFDGGIATRFTAAFWFKGTLAGTWVGKSGNSGMGWKTRPLSPKADFTMRNNGLGEPPTVASSMTSSNSVNDGNWHHIAAVFEGRASFRKLYVDGVLQAQVTGTSYAVTFSQLSHLLLGATQGNAANDPIGTFFPGLLYDVRMYNYPLTGNQVASLHSPGLIGHWISGAADLTDTSGFTLPGTHDGVAVGANAGSLNWSPDVPAGFTGQALDLSAGNVAVLVTNTAETDGKYQPTFDASISNKFTAAFWFKGTAAGAWVSKSGITPWGWQTRMLGANPDFTVRSSAGGLDGGSMAAPNVVNDDNWHHFAVVFDCQNPTSTRQSYVDGVLAAQRTGTATYFHKYATLAHLLLGANQANSAGSTIGVFFPGQLYDVRMYNYTLSAAEVESVYSRRPILKGITGPGPAGFTLQGSTAYAGNLVTMKATSLSPTDWTPVQTNAVAGGNFTITIPLGLDPKAFYQLMVP